MLIRSTIRKFILPAILLLTGCKEVYYPVIDRQMEALVIEGLMTNLKESYKVKLTMASTYDSTLSSEGITGALVSITDDLGNIYLMHENHFLKSYYSDPSEFVAVAGRSYALHIEMPGGEVYESTAQKLLPPASIDSIHGISGNKEFWYTDQLGDIVSRLVYGSETFMDIGNNSDSVYQYRLDNYIINCYSFRDLWTPEMKAAGITFPPPKDCPGTVCPYLIYNWKRFDLKTSINLTATTQTFSSDKLFNSTVCFFSFDSAAFPLNYKMDSCGYDVHEKYVCGPIRQKAGPAGKALQTRLYALNQASSVYYQELNKQLSAEGKLFDPIAVQLQGNMRCISNPGKLALGLFEVSSCTTKSYWLTFNYGTGEGHYQPIGDLSGLPDAGSSKVMPGFWIP